MVNVSEWMNELVKALDKEFSHRLWFVGLQGSYNRGEATDQSDIDAVVILDKISVSDIKAYNEILDALPHRDLACGFFSGKDEIFGWEPSDLLNLYYDTTPVFGSLDDLKSLITADAVDRAIKIGACNIYHGCVHNMLYDKSEEILTSLYKSAFFVVQAICFKKTGIFTGSKNELLKVAEKPEKEIISILLSLKNGEEGDFDIMSQTLFGWTKKLITTV